MRRILQHELGEKDPGFVAAKGRLAGQTFVRHAAERKDVGSPVHIARAIDGFRRKVARCPDEIPRPRKSASRVHQLGDAKIQHLELLNLAIEKKQILRLDVAMDDLVGMRIGQRFGGLPEQHHGVDKPGRFAFQSAGKVLTFQPLHHQIAVAAHHTVGQIAHDGRMLEHGENFCFLHEALAVAIFVRAQQFHTDLDMRNHIARAIHLSHATRRDNVLQPKAPGNES
jgi:hypothetical protein